jgi:hypothetical protein
MTESTGTWTVDEMDKTSKELFGRKASFAIKRGICVSCKKKALKNSFRSEEAYREYKECGLCQECEDDCL